MKTVPLKLPEAQIEFLEKLIEKGKFSSKAEAIRYALVLLMRRYYRYKRYRR